MGGYTAGAPGAATNHALRVYPPGDAPPLEYFKLVTSAASAASASLWFADGQGRDVTQAAPAVIVVPDRPRRFAGVTGPVAASVPPTWGR